MVLLSWPLEYLHRRCTPSCLADIALLHQWQTSPQIFCHSCSPVCPKASGWSVCLSYVLFLYLSPLPTLPTLLAPSSHACTSLPGWIPDAPCGPPSNLRRRHLLAALLERVSGEQSLSLRHVKKSPCQWHHWQPTLVTPPTPGHSQSPRLQIPLTDEPEVSFPHLESQGTHWSCSSHLCRLWWMSGVRQRWAEADEVAQSWPGRGRNDHPKENQVHSRHA